MSKLPKIDAISNFWIYLASQILRSTDHEKVSEGLDLEETRSLTSKTCKLEMEGERREEWNSKDCFLNLVAKLHQALC